MSKSAVVAGYATLDYVVRLPVPLTGASTATVAALTGCHWPRAGGAPWYTARRLAAAGHDARAHVAVGDDANGDIYLQACRDAGVGVTQIWRSARVRTPWCILLYHDDGQYTCLIDRGNVDEAMPTTAAGADIDLLCIAAGSAQASAVLLATVPDRTLVAWIAKRDPHSFPDWLMTRLARRSDIIFCNASERPLIDAARQNGLRAGQAIVETRGANGVLVEQGETKFELVCEPLRVQDATGAGDTLAGEVLACMLSGNDIEFAVRQGLNAARDLLTQRVRRD